MGGGHNYNIQGASNSSGNIYINTNYNVNVGNGQKM